MTGGSGKLADDGEKVPRPTTLGDGLSPEGELWIGRELGMAVGWPWPQPKNGVQGFGQLPFLGFK